MAASREPTPDSVDVLYNWNKINGKVEGFGVALQAAQFHMVDSLTAPDDYTLVWKLKP
ncbi:MAG: hypothetical protein M9925_03255 [Chloroflexi bacterium]|nr:hypothetical protein [Chloroflexota bacterium]